MLLSLLLGGALYGTTQSSTAGQVVRLDPPKSALPAAGQPWPLTTLASFAGGTDGALPIRLTAGAGGRFYGTTMQGGDASCTPMFTQTGAVPGCGVVFSLTPSATGYTKTTIWRFSGGADGASSYGALINDGIKLVLGTTFSGGTGGLGTVYKINIPNH